MRQLPAVPGGAQRRFAGFVTDQRRVGARRNRLSIDDEVEHPDHRRAAVNRRPSTAVSTRL